MKGYQIGLLISTLFLWGLWFFNNSFFEVAVSITMIYFLIKDIEKLKK